MSKIFIGDLLAGQRVESCFAVVRKETPPFKDPSKGNYLAMTLGDRSGRIEARKWDNWVALEADLQVGDIIRIRAIVEEYRNNLQLNLIDMEIVPAGEVNFAEYLPMAPRPIDEMTTELKELISGLDDKAISEFLAAYLGEKTFLHKYSLAPAAINVHHNYLGGLLEHSLEVATIAGVVAKMYPQADYGMLVAGALLHDIGKMEEYSYHAFIYFSDKGRLLSHTVLGYEMVNNSQAAKKYLTEEQKLHLGHLILSHHGKYEMGAPVLPQTLEAVILHQADMMSSKAKQVQQVLTNDIDSTGDWTSYNRLLERYLYRGFTDSYALGKNCNEIEQENLNCKGMS